MKNYSAPKKMKKIGDLFEKYKKNLKAPQATVEKAYADAIKKVAGYEIEKTQIRYTVGTKTIHLQIPSLLKSELRFKQKEILDEVKRNLGEKEVPEVIF